MAYQEPEGGWLYEVGDQVDYRLSTSPRRWVQGRVTARRNTPPLGENYSKISRHVEAR